MLEKELLPDIGRQYSLAQKMLDDAAKGFGSCKEPWNATQVSQVRDKHQSCRSDESNIFAQVKNTCDEAQALTEVKVKKCAKLKGVDTYPQEAPAVCDKDSSDVSYELHARRIRNFYMQKVHEWVVTEEACTNATQRATEKVNACQSGNETWRDKRSSCNAVQRTLDMSTCDAWTEYYHCSQNNSCLVEATTTYLDANTTATSMHRSMLLQWRAMKRIGCLLDALEHNKNADDLSDAITECRNKVHSVTSWALSYPYYKDWKPQLPSVGKVCEEPNFERPGKQSYKQAEYETLPTTAPADTCTADCCTRCWYFTCNSTTVPKPNQQQLTGFSQEECCAEPTNPAWKYDAWPQASCDMQCGLAAEYETRKLECWDLDSNLKLDESLCREVKPSTARTKCEETPKCGICEESDCSRGYVLKNLVPASCQGAMCTTAECCDKVCSAEDCPEGSTVRFPARICDGMTCSEAVCCSATKWKTGDWSNTGKCSTECGEVEKISNRTVTCEDGSGRAVEERFCAEAKPPSGKVACSATQACPEWIYSPWGNATYDCPEDCGQGQQTQERPVTCNEPDTGKVVADDLCKGPKPATARILCPATPLCVTTTSTSTSTTTTTTETTTTTTTGTTTSTTTIATCDFFLCPRGYLLKPVADRLDRCAGVCEVDECCNMASWVFENWDETKECSPSCGLATVEETRSVTCQVKATGKQMSRDTCQQAEPSSKRLVCPATADCDGCGSIWCGADSVPLPEAPNCGSSCTRELCCRKFATGFAALNVSENAAAAQNSAQVANQGSVGGSVEFDGEPAKPSEGGRSYHLGGKTGLLLGGTKSSEFTAVIYIKLQGSDNAQEETVMLKEGGPEDFGAWELVATPLKQLRIRSFKDSETQAAIGCLCLSSYADEWAAVTVRYDGKGKKIELIVNGKVCCEAAADADPSWSDAALLNGSAPVHLGLVPGSKRPGVVGEVSTVQLWDVVLADTDLSHITAQFSQAAAWSPAKNLRCQSNIIYSNSGVEFAGLFSTIEVRRKQLGRSMPTAVECSQRQKLATAEHASVEKPDLRAAQRGDLHQGGGMFARGLSLLYGWEAFKGWRHHRPCHQAARQAGALPCDLHGYPEEAVVAATGCHAQCHLRRCDHHQHHHQHNHSGPRVLQFLQLPCRCGSSGAYLAMLAVSVYTYVPSSRVGNLQPFWGSIMPL
ncbi:Adamts20 [Symbiodinium natans]|uniref:Adamts20 protein n=1 Tax=Symbiodinium natans TaxID=878477 RepID=A0A812I840_9DINO|nr:Adamts20 [Symbiodinium natans]